MKIAISNLAWNLKDNDSISKILLKNNIKYIEIATTKIWPKPKSTNKEVLSAYKMEWKKKGVDIISLQSLMYDQPNLQLFNQSKLIIQHLKAKILMAKTLGAKRLVFGAPKSRNLGSLTKIQAIETSISIFKDIGDFAAQNGVIFCIEPNPRIYGNDFIINSDEGAQLVNQVNSKGFGLHLDIAAMFLENENIIEQIKKHQSKIKHFHLSAPYLKKIDLNSKQIPYIECLKYLKLSGYNEGMTIEVVAQENNQHISQIDELLKLIQSVLS